MAIAGDQALARLEAIKADNAAGEFYLPDLVEMGAQEGLRAVAIMADEEEVMGVNDRVHLRAPRRRCSGGCARRRCWAGRR